MTRSDALRLVARLEETWNARAIERLAACFAADADFVTPLNHWARGRQEIEQMYARGLQTLFTNSRMRYELLEFREVEPGFGVMHVRWESEGHKPSGIRHTTEQRSGLYTWTVHDMGDNLEIVACHGTEALEE